MVACLVVFPTLLAVALAQQAGLVVQLEGEGFSGPVTAQLDDGSSVTEVVLNDDGTSPDVVASDGRWGGSVGFGGDSVSVLVTAGDQQFSAGPVAWEGEGPKDLFLTVQSGVMEARASNVAGGGLGSTATPGQASGPPVSGAHTSGPVSTAGSDTELFVGLGVGLLLLTGLGFLWTRRRGGAGYDVDTCAVRVPEPALLGPGTPSVSDGRSVWVVSEGDGADFLAALVARLARHHRVLVVGGRPPPVPRGPVYVMEGRGGLQGTVRALVRGRGLPLVVVFVGPDEEVPAPSLVLASQGEGLVVERIEGGWSIDGAVMTDAALEPRLGEVA